MGFPVDRQTQECPPGQTFNMCGSACPITCDNINDPPAACIQVCVSDCFCAANTYWDASTSSCVPKDKCPVLVEDSQSSCKGGQVFIENGTACPKRCSEPQADVECSKDFVAGCFCLDDMIWDERTKLCVNDWADCFVADPNMYYPFPEDGRVEQGEPDNNAALIGGVVGGVLAVGLVAVACVVRGRRRASSDERTVHISKPQQTTKQEPVDDTESVKMDNIVVE